MTRIIAGAVRGRRLLVPTGDTTRPTADRVREALFSALQSQLGSLAGIRFLDLYAGSGAVGLEAWSRGAEFVLCVERYRKAVEVIGKNVATLGAGAQVHVRTGAVLQVLAQPQVLLSATPFDVVFVDAPYAATNAEMESVVRSLLAHNWLAESATVVVERTTRQPAFAWPPEFEVQRARKYGETNLHFAELGAGS